MVHALCQTCLQPYRLMIAASEVSLIKQVAAEDGRTAPCPRQCGGSINLVGDPGIDALTENARLREAMTLTGTELYRAVNGAGLPDEIPTDGDTIRSHLLANRVGGLLLEIGEGGKYYLHELHLENGVILHLTAGLKGAEVLKITKRVSDVG